jgi:hypothetical protein
MNAPSSNLNVDASSAHDPDISNAKQLYEFLVLHLPTNIFFSTNDTPVNAIEEPCIFATLQTSCPAFRKETFAGTWKKHSKLMQSESKAYPLLYKHRVRCRGSRWILIKSAASLVISKSPDDQMIAPPATFLPFEDISSTTRAKLKEVPVTTTTDEEASATKDDSMGSPPLQLRSPDPTQTAALPPPSKAYISRVACMGVSSSSDAGHMRSLVYAMRSAASSIESNLAVRTDSPLITLNGLAFTTEDGNFVIRSPSCTFDRIDSRFQSCSNCAALKKKGWSFVDYHGKEKHLRASPFTNVTHIAQNPVEAYQDIIDLRAQVKKLKRENARKILTKETVSGVEITDTNQHGQLLDMFEKLDLPSEFGDLTPEKALW